MEESFLAHVQVEDNEEGGIDVRTRSINNFRRENEQGGDLQYYCACRVELDVFCLPPLFCNMPRYVDQHVFMFPYRFFPLPKYVI